MASASLQTWATGTWLGVSGSLIGPLPSPRVQMSFSNEKAEQVSKFWRHRTEQPCTVLKKKSAFASGRKPNAIIRAFSLELPALYDYFLLPTYSLVPALGWGSAPSEETSCKSSFQFSCASTLPTIPSNEWGYLNEKSREKFHISSFIDYQLLPHFR